MLQSPQLLSHIHICPKPKVKLGPTYSFYPAPPSSDVIATATNPRQIGLTDRDLGLTDRDLGPLPKSVSPSLSNRYYRDYNANSLVNLLPKSVLPSLCNRSHRVCLTNSLVSLLPKSVHRVCVIGHTKITLCPNPNHIGPTELHVGPTKNPNGH